MSVPGSQHDDRRRGDGLRALLRRQAATRFDADTAAHLADLLAPIADPKRLAEIGDRLVRSDPATEFLAASIRLTSLTAAQPARLPTDRYW